MTRLQPVVRRGRALAGRFTPPGDKSITHRAVLFGLIAEGTTEILGANPGGDCRASLRCAEALGAEVRAGTGEDGIAIEGPGALVSPAAALDCGNSGTTMRLLAGLLAGREATAELVGDASLSRRPMGRVLEPLRRMGAAIDASPGDHPPMRVRGGTLRGIDYGAPVASAQVATCVLLAGVSAAGETTVRLPGPARDHTERMLPAFGVPLRILAAPGGGRSVSVQGGARPRGCRVRVPGDVSAAAFLLAAAAAQPGAIVTAEGVNLNPTRTGLLDVLAAMGAGVEIANTHDVAGEPLGDVTVSGPEGLRAFDVPAEWVPRLIDEVPAWAVAASAARGTSRIGAAAELRVKESDRIAALARNLAAVGITARERPDGLEIDGGPARGGRVLAHLDHRIVMAFAALGCRTAEPVTFDDVSSVATSFPGFFDVLGALGAGVEWAAA